MGWGHAFVLGAVVLSATHAAAAEADTTVLVSREDPRQLQLTLTVFGAPAPPPSPLFQRTADPGAAAQSRRGEALLFGYSLGAAQATFRVRAGYRYGLPLDEPIPVEDRVLVLTSGGTIAVSAGTVAWLQLDLDGFKEIAGARIMRVDAVPGLRFRVGEASPFEAGIGCLAAVERLEGDTFGISRIAAVVQLSGRF